MATFVRATKLDGTVFLINLDQVWLLRRTVDDTTLVRFGSGNSGRLVVRETPAQILESKAAAVINVSEPLNLDKIKVWPISIANPAHAINRAPATARRVKARS